MRSEPLHSFTDHTWQVSTASFSNCSKYLATGGWDKSIVVYDVLDLKQMFKLRQAHSQPITRLLWLDQDLITCSADTTTVLWDTNTGQKATTFTGHSNWVMSGDVTDRNITTAGWDGNLGVWDPNQSKPITFLKGHVAGVWDCAGLKSSHVIVSASEDCTLRLWDRRTGESFSTLAGAHDDSVLSVCWPSHRETLIASGSTDCSIILWDTRTCKPLTKVESHNDSVKQLVSLPHKPGTMASIGDNTLKLWETEGEVRLLGTRAFPTDLDCVAVSPDRVTHVCGGVNSSSYMSLLVGADDEAHSRLRTRYHAALDRNREAEEAQVSGYRSYSNQQAPKPSDQRFIPRTSSAAASSVLSPRSSTETGELMTSFGSETSTLMTALETSVVTLSVSESHETPVVEGKRESSCSDSGVDVTSISITCGV